MKKTTLKAAQPFPCSLGTTRTYLAQTAPSGCH